jgi:hypothetical protein
VVCNAVFSHSYDLIPDIFEAMRRTGVTETCGVTGGPPGGAPLDRNDSAQKILVRTWDIAPDGSHESTIERVMTASEYASHTANKEATKERAMAYLQAGLEQRGGRDREDSVRHFPHPGANEIRASLDSVTAEWRSIPDDVLRFYFSTGRAPTDVTPEDMAQFMAAATACVASTEQDPLIQSLLARMTVSMREQFYAAVPLGSRAPNLVPALWLAQKMDVLHVRKELKDKVQFTMERKAVMTSVEALWLEAVKLHNGFCKTVLELKQHA